MFNIGDITVHPQHGVARVVGVESRSLGGEESTVFVLQMLDSDLRMMVPEQSAQRVGLRPIMKNSEAEDILDILKARDVAVSRGPWNRRFKAYKEMLGSGLPAQIAQVYRDMYRLKFNKDLSFGERRLLDQAKSLLVRELALAKAMAPASIEGQLEQILST